MNTSSNAPVNALHFTEELADRQGNAGLEDLILSALPDLDLYDAEYHELPYAYRQDGGSYVDVQMHIVVPGTNGAGTSYRHTFILDEGEWLVETPGTQHGYTVMSDYEYREFAK